MTIVRRMHAGRCARLTPLALCALLLASGCGKRDREPGAAPGAAPGAPPAATAARYYCPMHPTYTSDKPGDCPICNMRLVPFTPEPSAAPPGGEHLPHAPAAPTDSSQAADTAQTPAGHAVVQISPQRQQLIGVKLAPVVRGTMARSIRAMGKVTYDETKLHHVHVKVDGWIGKLYVSYTGQYVDEGSPLFTFYSPEIVATQEEYLLALRAARASQDSAAADLVRSVERRLLLWDLHESQLAEIALSGRAKTYVDIVSHGSGVVTEKDALEGMRAMPGAELYTLADLSQVWVSASVYEYELPLVKVGQRAIMRLTYGTAESLQGRIDYIYPYLDEQTRTAQVRLEFPNPKQLLKPGMFAEVTIDLPLGTMLTVPADAILDSGERQLVFVARGNGEFEPRAVQLGQRSSGQVEVLTGLTAGEQVVVGAHFLIDSESQLRAALQGMGAAGEHQH